MSERRLSDVTNTATVARPRLVQNRRNSKKSEAPKPRALVDYDLPGYSPEAKAPPAELPRPSSYDDVMQAVDEPVCMPDPHDIKAVPEPQKLRKKSSGLMRFLFLCSLCTCVGVRALLRWSPAPVPIQKKTLLLRAPPAQKRSVPPLIIIPTIPG